VLHTPPHVRQYVAFWSLMMGGVSAVGLAPGRWSTVALLAWGVVVVWRWRRSPSPDPEEWTTDRPIASAAVFAAIALSGTLLGSLSGANSLGGSLLVSFSVACVAFVIVAAVHVLGR
jgi:hypothetical protein